MRLFPSRTSRVATSHHLYLRIAPDKFHFLKFILEGYDNLAILSSVDNHNGVVLIRYTEPMQQELLQLLTDLAQDIKSV